MSGQFSSMYWMLSHRYWPNGMLGKCQGHPGCEQKTHKTQNFYCLDNYLGCGPCVFTGFIDIVCSITFGVTLYSWCQHCPRPWCGICGGNFDTCVWRCSCVACMAGTAPGCRSCSEVTYIISMCELFWSKDSNLVKFTWHNYHAYKYVIDFYVVKT